MTLAVDLKALHDDAKTWNHVAEITSTAKQAVDGFQLGESDLSWASRSTGLLATYELIRAKAAMLLQEATANCRDLGWTLDHVAEAYEISDQFGAKRFRGVWDPKS